MAIFERAEFQLDSIPDASFVGYSDGSDWNGFECPYFEYDTAREVLRRSEINGFEWSYDASDDTFIVSNNLTPDDEPERFDGMTIEAEGLHIKVYPIGAYSWIWGVPED